MCGGTQSWLRALGIGQDGRWGSEYDGTLKKTKTDAQGRELYPDSSANQHSTGASGAQQSGMKIGGPDGRPSTTSGGGSTGGLKGDQPLTESAGGSSASGGTDALNY